MNNDDDDANSQVDLGTTAGTNLLTLKQVAAKLQYSVRTVQRMAEARELTAFPLREGGRRFVAEVDLERYIARQRERLIASAGAATVQCAPAAVPGAPPLRYKPHVVHRLRGFSN